MSTDFNGEFMFRDADKNESPICQIHLRSNFPLPSEMAAVVVGFEKGMPELPELLKPGLCFSLAFNDDRADRRAVSAYLGLLNKAAGVRSGQVVPTSRQYPVIQLGRGHDSMRFMMEFPRSPGGIIVDFVARCYQPVQALRPLPAAAPPRQLVAQSSNTCSSSATAAPPGLAAPPPHGAFPYPYGAAPYAFPYGVPPPVPHPGPYPYPYPYGGVPYPFPHAPPPQPPPPSRPPQAAEAATEEESTAASSTTTGPPATAEAAPAAPRGPRAAPARQQAALDKSMLATSAQAHPHVFGAIAELVDNSWDQAATDVRIGILEEGGAPVFHVMDDGNGMSHAGMRRMLSMGHAREEHNKHKLGKYGVGFKNGAMRIGETAVIITREEETASVGILSKDMKTGDPEDRTLWTPVVTFKMPNLEIDTGVHTEEEAEEAQKAIVATSGLSEKRLTMDIGKLGAHGTLIYIMGLQKAAEADDHPDQYELEWTDGNILLSSKKKRRRPGNRAVSMPIDWDLAAYMQLLYAAVDRQFKISIQGRVVKRGKAFEMGVLKKKSHVFKKRFPIHFEKDVKGLDRNATDVARLIFGFSEELARDFNCGVCIYWRNRMITSFDTMDMMNEKDFGIIGIASTGNILNPTNNKQEFVDNLRNFQLTEEWIRDCFRDYKEEFFGEQIQAKTEQHDIEDTWAFCDSCGKSRRLPRGVSVPDDSHEQWFCWYLPKDNAFFGCEAPQEEEKPTEVTVGVINAGKRITHENRGNDPKKQKSG
uniref:Morc family cw-type zinc finger protein 3 n=1 Tax=Tetraselmis sp. GSL018 TaxID=582737 RepID=A0A061RB16_9CHLO|mmetsp:Transcript_22310/g.53354  ORF Transcript_22310/g.53354 Transcript_22310/m.53354 type:complete len:760 (+) Transcript_22310:281-2560(+)|eukprot:CAMPEP_0177589920 /NCGR_PEP_ID=MMETSP0419_2-20121207/7095_1 /TAXON_ID=582737 /ORGANISM="Tetraselmis sp., Strain GSL018" /LENGTH=759 /DNA_ID=CAMNT_0019080375 /DNA_START=243 /DNA_END=2522 /DNA_ORIENTATION=+